MSLTCAAMMTAVDEVYSRTDAAWVDTWMLTQHGEGGPAWLEDLADLVGYVWDCYAQGRFDDTTVIHALARITALAIE